MSTVQTEQVPERTQQAIGAFFIPLPQLEQYWAQIDRILEQAESWTQIISSSEIREQLDTSRMLAWGMLDNAGQFGLAIARLNDCVRGTICTAWVILPMAADADDDDDESVCALLHEVETFARFRRAAVLEVLTAPWSAIKARDNLKCAKITGAILEVDLRVPRRPS